MINNNYVYANGRISILDVDFENISKIRSSKTYKKHIEILEKN